MGLQLGYNPRPSPLGFDPIWAPSKAKLWRRQEEIHRKWRLLSLPRPRAHTIPEVFHTPTHTLIQTFNPSSSPFQSHAIAPHLLQSVSTLHLYLRAPLLSADVPPPPPHPLRRNPTLPPKMTPCRWQVPCPIASTCA